MKLVLEETYKPGVYTDKKGNKLELTLETRNKLSHTGGLVAHITFSSDESNP